MPRTKKNPSDGLYIAHSRGYVVLIKSGDIRRAVKAGYTVSPAYAYLSTAYINTDNNLLKAIIAYAFPECAYQNATQDELPLE